MVVAVATPILSFLAVLLGQWLTRRSARELDTWRRREETMRMVRWAVESVSAENATLGVAGLAVLTELMDSELLQDEDRSLVTTVTQMVSQVTAALAYAEGEPEAYTRARGVVVDGQDDGEEVRRDGDES